MRVDEMPAGREMDILIADKAFGSVRYTTKNGLEIGLIGNSIAMYEWERPVEEKYRFEDDGTPRWEQGNGQRWFTQLCPHYSTDIAAWGQVSDKLQEIGLHKQYLKILAELCGLGKRGGFKDTYSWDEIWQMVDAPLENRCQAALKALGVEEI